MLMLFISGQTQLTRFVLLSACRSKDFPRLCCIVPISSLKKSLIVFEKEINVGFLLTISFLVVGAGLGGMF